MSSNLRTSLLFLFVDVFAILDIYSCLEKKIYDTIDSDVLKEKVMRLSEHMDFTALSALSQVKINRGCKTKWLAPQKV